MTDQHNPITPGEYDLALTVDADGAIVLHHSSMCDRYAAEALRLAADALEARHGNSPCRPLPVEQDDEGNLVDVPLNSSDGRLDTERRVWTDGAGHAWDLSLRWMDATGQLWQWTGRRDRAGRAPVMRVVDGSNEIEPLDVVRALYGPIAPAGGETR